MGLNGVSFSTSGLTDDLNIQMNEYLTQSESIHDLLNDTAATLDVVQSDYDDDGVYNGSSGYQFVESTLSLDGINKQMTFEEVNELFMQLMRMA